MFVAALTRQTTYGLPGDLLRIFCLTLLLIDPAFGDESDSSIPVVPREQSTLLEQHTLKQGKAQQGLALTKDRFYSSTSNTIYQYDTKWNLQNSRRIQIDGVNHLGAIHYHDGFLWAGLLHGPENGSYDKQLDRGVIAKIHADDLSVVQTWDVTAEVSWIDPVCFDGDSLWVGDLSKLGIHRYRLRDGMMVHDGILRYPAQMHFSQGIRIVGTKLYSIHTFGEMDGLFEFELPAQLTDSVVVPNRVWAIQETQTHLEGFDFIPGTIDQIWHAQGESVDRYQLDGLSSAPRVPQPE